MRNLLVNYYGKRTISLVSMALIMLGAAFSPRCLAQQELDIKSLKKEADKKDSTSSVKQKLAMAYVLSGELSLAERYLARAHEQGDASAAFRLARLYETYKIIPSDKKLRLATPDEAALFFYQQAAVSIPLASLRAGEMLFNKDNFNDAAPFLRNAAENRLPEAFFLYGRCILFGNIGQAEDAAYYLHVAMLLDERVKDKALADLTRLKSRSSNPESIARGIELAENYVRNLY